MRFKPDPDVYFIPRILMMAFGFILIFLDLRLPALSPWAKYVGGFFAIYAFAPGKYNPLLDFMDEMLGKMQGKTREG